MIDRRTFLTSAAPLLAMPGASVLAGPAKRLGTTTMRAALDAYLDAYCAFFGVPLSDLPDDNDGSAKSIAIWQGWLDRCRTWRSTRKTLAALVVEHAGLNSPPTILAAMVDLGDVLILVTGDSDYEGASGYDCTQTENVSLVPTSPAMKSIIAALPSWDGSDVCDDTYHREFHFEHYLENPRTPEEKASARAEAHAAEAERKSRPTLAEVITAINEANASDDAILASNKDGSADDESTEAVVKRQDECWERVRDLTRRYAGLPEDFPDRAVTVGDYIVTIAGNRGYETPDSVQTAGVDVWPIKRVY